jgi:hypothetical protein
MRCISPLKASYDKQGDITYSSRKSISGLVPFEFECRKCLPCRLNIAREKAIRSVHEAKMHKDNIFLTLTYDDKNLTSEKLIYEDFQNFMKRLRKKVSGDIKSKYIPYIVTGEYGEINKRPHWHALLFNYAPSDRKLKYTTERGEHVWTSEFIDSIWQKGMTEFGSVTMDSAGYVARYAAKKLVHGKDQDHDYHPIHKTSNRRAIGRSWIEKYWKHTFENGFIVLQNGDTAKIPRYYLDWLKENQPEMWLRYVSEIRPKIIKKAEKAARREEIEDLTNMMNYKGGTAYPKKRSRVKETILKSKFKRLQERLKL